MMDDREWAIFCYRQDLDNSPMIQEIALHRAGFADVGTFNGEELWEDPCDPAYEGGAWIGRVEAMRRIRVRVAQAKLGYGPLIEGDAEG